MLSAMQKINDTRFFTLSFVATVKGVATKCQSNRGGDKQH